jgi:3-methyladenine DNA glycosylase Mpg
MDNYAKEILLRRSLLVNGKIIKIAEIEFYLYSQDHPDPYVHCHQDQKLYGSWYFHRFKNGSYKGGTYKGLDITMGTKDQYFGVLIRSIYVNNILIEGPCRTVNYILEQYNCKDVKEFTGGKNLSVTNNNKEFHLLINDSNNWNADKIVNGTRIGLKGNDQWTNKKYRYLISDIGIKKEKSSLKKIN